MTDEVKKGVGSSALPFTVISVVVGTGPVITYTGEPITVDTGISVTRVVVKVIAGVPGCGGQVRVNVGSLASG